MDDTRKTQIIKFLTSQMLGNILTNLWELVDDEEREKTDIMVNIMLSVHLSSLHNSLNVITRDDLETHAAITHFIDELLKFIEHGIPIANAESHSNT